MAMRTWGRTLALESENMGPVSFTYSLWEFGQMINLLKAWFIYM